MNFREICFPNCLNSKEGTHDRTFVLPWSHRGDFAHNLFARGGFIPNAPEEPLGVCFELIGTGDQAEVFSEHIATLSRIYGNTQYGLARVTYPLVLEESEPVAIGGGE